METTLSSHDRIFLLFVSKHLFVLFVFFLSNMKGKKTKSFGNSGRCAVH